MAEPAAAAAGPPPVPFDTGLSFLDMVGTDWTGASPRIFEWRGRIVDRCLTYPQNTLKIGKGTGFGPLHLRI